MKRKNKVNNKINCFSSFKK